MADITPLGITDQPGRQNVLRPGDALVNPFMGLLNATGMPGVTGIQGFTGLSNSTLGNTGVFVTGFTGVQGITGASPIGETGIDGQTGVMGATGIAVSGQTGLLGETGIQGETGLVGLAGITGVRGYTGLQGETGLLGLGATGVLGASGISIIGNTGLQGETGIHGETGLQGHTGVGLLGATGLRGSTGIIGNTGMLDLVTVNVQQQVSGVTLLYVIPANEFNQVGQQLEITSWGLTATDGSSTTINVSYAGTTVFTDTVSLPGGSDILLDGYILLWGAISHDITIKGTYQTGDGKSAYVANLLFNPGTSQNLYVSLSSAGTGHILYGLVVRKQQPGINNSV